MEWVLSDLKMRTIEAKPAQSSDRALAIALSSLTVEGDIHRALRVAEPNCVWTRVAATAEDNLPRQRNRLHETEALYRFNDAFLNPKPAILDAAKRRAFDPVAGDFVDVHCATTKSFHALDGIVE